MSATCVLQAFWLCCRIISNKSCCAYTVRNLCVAHESGHSIWFCLMSRAMFIHSQVAPPLPFNSNFVNTKEHKRTWDSATKQRYPATYTHLEKLFGDWWLQSISVNRGTKLAAVLISTSAHLADLLEILMHYKFVSIIHQKWGKIWKNTNKLLMLAQFKRCQHMYFTDPHLLNLCQAARPKTE